MTKNNIGIPVSVTIGVTGHRALQNESVIRMSVREVLKKLDKMLGHTKHTFTIISPLAEGADRIVAREVLRWHLPIESDKPSLDVILPFSKKEYLKDFNSVASKDEFNELFSEARNKKIIAKRFSRIKAYEHVGREVVNNCDILIAIWNGKPAIGEGGTEKIIEYAREVGRTFYWINSETGKIIEERKEDRTLETLGHLNTYNKERLSSTRIELEVENNYDVTSGQAKNSGLPQNRLKFLRKSLLHRFVRASLLAQRYQSLYMKSGTAVYALAALAVVIITIQTLIFSQTNLLLFLEAIVIAIILLLLALSRTYNWHRKWIDYRFLAERLRAAIFLQIVGMEFFTINPQKNVKIIRHYDEWVVMAFNWVWENRPYIKNTKKVPFRTLKNFLVSAWIDDQISYYKKRSLSHGLLHIRLARLGELLFALTFIVSIIHIFEHGAHDIDISNILTTIAIIFPAIGASLSGIRVHREYLRNSERYGSMSRHLSFIREQLIHTKNMKTFTELIEKANDMMLNENLDWRVVLIYQKLHAP